MLHEKSILIVEDELLIALDIADRVCAMGGVPVGPFATVAEAMAAIAVHAIHGAILDAMLLDRDITPVAVHLVERTIPLVIYTGTGLPQELRDLHPHLPVVMKPARVETLLDRLVRRMINPNDGAPEGPAGLAELL